MAVTRIKNNQITDATITYAKIAPGTLVGSLFNEELTLNSNVTITGNLSITGTSSQINATNTYINDPLVIFNNGYVGSPSYDIGMLINRNLNGGTNSAWVWVEADSAFAGLLTTETGSTTGAINNSGYADLKIGSITSSGDLTVNQIDGTVINASSTVNVEGVFTANAAANLNSNLTVTGSTVLASTTIGTGLTLSASTTVDAGANAITNLADPSNNQDAATKAYVDGLVSTTDYVRIADGDSTLTISDTSTNLVLQFNGTSYVAIDTTDADFYGLDISTTGAVYAANVYDSNLTATEIVYAGAGGQLQSWSGLTYNDSTSTLTTDNIIADSIKDTSLTSGRVVIVDVDGLLADSSSLTFNGTTLTVPTVAADLTGDVTGTVSSLSNHDTDDLAEGLTNQYHTTSRVRQAISATDNGGDGSFSYDNVTGEFTYTGPSSSEVRAHFSVTDNGGDGSLTYNDTTGVFTYTGPDDTEIRAHFSGGTGVDITNGVVSIGQDVSTTANVTFNTVTATINGNIVGDITGNVTGNLTGDVTGNVTGNLTGDVTGTVSDISNHDTDDLAEGSTNLYYTDSRARNSISATDAGGDGSFSYNSSTGEFTYTGPSSSEVRAHLSGGTGVGYDDTTGVISIGQSVGTTDGVTFANVTDAALTSGRVVLAGASGILSDNSSLTFDGTTLTTTDISTTGDVTIGGNLTVTGTMTAIQSTIVEIDDLNLTLAKGAADATAANGAGLTVDGASATILYVSATDSWDLNKDLKGTNADFSGNVDITGTFTAGSASFDAIDNTPIGSTTASTGKFTTLTSTNLTDTRVAFATTDGELTDDGDFTFDSGTNTLSVTNITATAVTADLTGDVTGDLTGNVTASNVSVSDTLTVGSTNITGSAGGGGGGGGGGTASRTFNDETSTTEFSGMTNTISFGIRTKPLVEAWSSFSVGDAISFVVNGTTYTSTISQINGSSADPMMPIPYELVLNNNGWGMATNGQVTTFTINGGSTIDNAYAITLTDYTMGGTPVLRISNNSLSSTNPELNTNISSIPSGATITAYEMMGDVGVFTLTSAFTLNGSYWEATYTKTSGTSSQYSSFNVSQAVSGGGGGGGVSSLDISTGVTVTGDVTATTFIGDLTGDVTGNVTGNLTGDVTGDVTGTVSSLSNHDTDDLSEGETNLYYTDSRARNSVSATDAGGDGSFSYNSSTGEFTYTGPSSSEVRAHFSVTDNGGDGSLTYDDTTGVFTYTGPDSSEARAHFSVDDQGGDGSLSYNSATGVFTYIGPDDAEVRAHLSGGTGVDYNSATGVIAIGQSVGTTDNVTFATVTADLTGSVTGTVSSLSNHDTDDLSEGSTNLYYTDVRARASVSVTDNGGDGSLTYDNTTGVITYTGPDSTEVRAHFSGGTGVDITNGVVSIGQAVATTDDVTFANVDATNFNGTVHGNVIASDVSTGTLTATSTSTLSDVTASGSVTINADATAGVDVVISGANDSTLFWSNADSTYDSVVIGGSATGANLVPGAKLVINSTDAILLPAGSNAQRPSGAGYTDVVGMLRYSTTSNAIEFYTGSQWQGVTTSFTVITDEQFSGDDSTTEFELAAASTTASTVVSINGVMQVPTLAYSVSGTTLTFTEAPADGDVIDVRRLTTTQSVAGLGSINSKMTIDMQNSGIDFYTGSSSTAKTLSVDTSGAIVSYQANTSVASANTATTIDSFAKATYRTAKYVIQATHGTDYQAVEALVVHNGTTASVVTYGVVETNGNLGVLSATINGSDVELKYIAANTSTTVRISKNYIVV